MFKLSTTLANYARREQYFISTTSFNILYGVSVILRVLEVCLLLTIIWASIWLLSFAF